MSKKHKHRNRQQNQGVAPGEQQDTGVEVGEDTGEELEGDDEGTGEDADAGEVSDAEMMAALGGTKPAAEQKPAEAEVPPPEAPASTTATFPQIPPKEETAVPSEKPAAAPVAQPPPSVTVAVADKSVVKPAEKVDLEKSAAKPVVSAPAMTFGVSPRRRQQMAARSARDLTQQSSSKIHSASGYRLIRMFDEYEAYVKTVQKTDVVGMKRAARKLYDIMVMVCPNGATANRGTYRELITIVLERMSAGYGTIYADSNLLRVDYSLPTPVDSMKFDAFWTAMYQLVEWMKTGRKATFNSLTLSKILNSPEVMNVINDIKTNLAAR